MVNSDSAHTPWNLLEDVSKVWLKCDPGSRWTNWSWSWKASYQAPLRWSPADSLFPTGFPSIPQGRVLTPCGCTTPNHLNHSSTVARWRRQPRKTGTLQDHICKGRWSDVVGKLSEDHQTLIIILSYFTGMEERYQNKNKKRQVLSSQLLTFDLQISTGAWNYWLLIKGLLSARCSPSIFFRRFRWDVAYPRWLWAIGGRHSRLVTSQSQGTLETNNKHLWTF